MALRRWQRLLQRVGPRAMVSAPAVWGKLPEQGDFVHYRSSMTERQAWQDWAQTLLEPAPLQHMPRKRRLGQTAASAASGWMHLEPQPGAQSPGALPVAFVLPPGNMPFAPQHCVQGVVLASQDRVGRACPLVIYQCASPAWMQRLWAEGAAMGGQDLLFWWARMAVSIVHGHTPWNAWVSLFDQVWQAHAPGWRQQWLGGMPGKVAPDKMHALLGPLQPDDPADYCTGVDHLPWVNWPQQLWQGPKSQAAYWTQDSAGRYAQASRHLTEIWGRQP